MGYTVVKWLELLNLNSINSGKWWIRHLHSQTWQTEFQWITELKMWNVFMGLLMLWSKFLGFVLDIRRAPSLGEPNGRAENFKKIVKDVISCQQTAWEKWEIYHFWIINAWLTYFYESDICTTTCLQHIHMAPTYSHAVQKNIFTLYVGPTHTVPCTCDCVELYRT